MSETQGKQTQGPQRQVAMVLDLNKCLGCHTCSIACKKMWNTDQGTDYAYWNSVETLPGKGFPANYTQTGGRGDSGEVRRGSLPSMDEGYGRAWTFNHKDVLASTGGPEKQWLKPNEPVKWGPNFDEDVGAGQYPQDNHYFYMPRLCNHCTHPACKDACPRGAIEKREQDGIVLVDQDRCHGHRFCVEACPYKKVYFDHVRQVSSKCIFCLPRIEEGVAPACARQCPGRLRFVGYRDDAQGPIAKLVDEWGVALPLHPEWGLGPNVFYVPPMSPPLLDARGLPTGEPRIPLSYLVSLFGPQVEQSLATLHAERDKRKRDEPSALMDLLIAYDWNENFKLEPQQREVFP